MTNQEGLLTPAQVKAMKPADMADFLRRNSGDANFQWQVREAILNRAAQMIEDLSTKLTAAAEAMVRSNHEIERLSAAHEPTADSTPLERAFAEEPQRSIVDQALRDIARCTCGDLWWETAQKNHRPGCPLNRSGD